MKKSVYAAILITVILAVTVIICGCEPYLKYPSAGIEPKMATNGKYVKYPEYKILNNYDEYVGYGVDLRYEKEFFDNNRLLIISITGCSSNAYFFADIVVDGNVIYPIIGENKTGDIVTDDIIYHVFYAELPQNTDYKLGKLIFADNNKVKFADRSILAFDLHYANLLNTPIRIEIEGAYPCVIEDVEQMREICDILLARNYCAQTNDPSKIYGAEPRIYLRFVYENPSDNFTEHYNYIYNNYNIRFVPKENDGLFELIYNAWSSQTSADN